MGAHFFRMYNICFKKKMGGAQKNRSEGGFEGGVRRARNFLVNPPPCRSMNFGVLQNQRVILCKFFLRGYLILFVLTMRF